MLWTRLVKEALACLLSLLVDLATDYPVGLYHPDQVGYRGGRLS